MTPSTDPKQAATDVERHVALEPCPFCGYAMSAEEDGAYQKAGFMGAQTPVWSVSCGDTKCNAEVSTTSKETAIAAWNRRALRQGGEAWQPIATAPKDGSYVLVANYGQEADEAFWHDGRAFCWREAGWYFADSDLLTSHPARPDVWMPKPTAPLPPPPAEGEAA